MPFYHIRRTIPNEHKLILSYSPGIAKISNFSIVSFIGIYGSMFKIARSAVPENGCLIFMHYRCGGWKKTKPKKHL